MVREARSEDLQALLELYLCLHEHALPEASQHLSDTWRAMLGDRNHHIIVNEIDGMIVSSCICMIILNLTRGVRPYALIENVVTAEGCRGKGYASECLSYAKAIAQAEHCYKMMLLTGSREQGTLDFYTRAGYNSTDKTAFVQWLE